MTAAQIRTAQRTAAIAESARVARERDMARGDHPTQRAKQPTYVRLSALLTPDEFTRLKTAAFKDGEGIPTFLRRIILDELEAAE